MSPITVLWGIDVTGIMLLLGLVALCVRRAYRAVQHAPARGAASTTDEPALPATAGTTNARDTATADGGCGDDDTKRPTNSDPDQQR